MRKDLRPPERVAARYLERRLAGKIKSADDLPNDPTAIGISLGQDSLLLHHELLLATTAVVSLRRQLATWKS